LSGDSDAPQVGGARSYSTSVVKVNRRKTNRRKMRPYCTVISAVIIFWSFHSPGIVEINKDRFTVLMTLFIL